MINKNQFYAIFILILKSRNRIMKYDVGIKILICLLYTKITLIIEFNCNYWNNHANLMYCICPLNSLLQSNLTENFQKCLLYSNNFVKELIHFAVFFLKFRKQSLAFKWRIRIKYLTKTTLLKVHFVHENGFLMGYFTLCIFMCQLSTIFKL